MAKSEYRASKLGNMSDVVIVIGAARSGTKVLREMLAASPNVAAVSFDVNFIWRTGNEGEANDVLI